MGVKMTSGAHTSDGANGSDGLVSSTAAAAAAASFAKVFIEEVYNNLVHFFVFR
jgi:hypothetical protein